MQISSREKCKQTIRLRVCWWRVCAHNVANTHTHTHMPKDDFLIVGKRANTAAAQTSAGRADFFLIQGSVQIGRKWQLGGVGSRAYNEPREMFSRRRRETCEMFKAKLRRNVGRFKSICLIGVPFSDGEHFFGKSNAHI